MSNQAIDQRIEELAHYLRRAGLKQTRQRELVARVVLAHQGHAAVDEIYRAARRLDPRVGYSTIYRTLRILKDAGLVAELQIGDGQTRYEPELSSHHHDHLICTSCRKIVEFECVTIEERQAQVARDHGFRVSSHKHEIYGLCPDCQD